MPGLPSEQAISDTLGNGMEINTFGNLLIGDPCISVATLHS